MSSIMVAPSAAARRVVTYLLRMSYYIHVHRHKGVYIISSPSAAPGRVVPKRLEALRHVTLYKHKTSVGCL